MAQEGRGLDAGPRLVQRLRSANDHRTANIVERICLEEMAHVAVGAEAYGPYTSSVLLYSQVSNEASTQFNFCYTCICCRWCVQWLGFPVLSNG